MNVPQPFQILKMDKRRGNIVVSRRAILEESRAEQRSEIVQQLEEGQVVDGVVKNITDYGAFVDLGGIDGLLHVTDIAWRRVNHPSEVLSIGETIKVQIVRINHESHRISLGMKQLQADPWDGIEAKYPVGAKFTGRVTNITDYGAFVELEPGVEGLIHVSEMSWTKKNVHPGKIVSTSQEVEVMVLEVDPDKRRISLGLKQTLQNPWESFAEKYPGRFGHRGRSQEQDRVRPVHRPGRRRRRHGPPLRPRLAEAGRAGARRLQPRRHGQGQGARRRRREGAHLARHQAARHRRRCRPAAATASSKGSVVTGTVIDVNDGGIEVQDRRQRDDRVHPPCRPLRATATTSAPSASPRATRSMPASSRTTSKTQRISLSIKALEIAEEKEAVAQFGSSDSGASLGDILGAALKDREKK